jgi:hypothetical protein
MSVRVYACMRIGHKNNRHRQIDEREYLLELSTVLGRITTGMGVSQKEIEKATGVDQTTISRAKNRKLSRVTTKVRRLRRYADIQRNKIRLSEEIKYAAEGFLAVGGTEDELLGSIRQATRIVLGHTS